MKTPSLLPLFLLPFLCCHKSSGGSSGSSYVGAQIKDLRDIGTWHLFQVLDIEQSTQNYTKPPMSFTIEGFVNRGNIGGSVLTRLGGIPFNTESWWFYFYDRKGYFSKPIDNLFNWRGSVRDGWGNWHSVSFSWIWLSDTPKKITEHSFVSIQIDRDSDVPQVIVIWRITTYHWDSKTAKSVYTENSITRMTFRPRR